MSAQQDKAFVKTFIGVIAVLVGVTIFLIFLAIGLQGDEDPERVALDRERAESRLQRVAEVHISGEPLPEMAQASAGGGDDTAALTAEQVVDQVCAGCHTTGMPGAPQVGAQADWDPRFAQGLETMVENAIQGIGTMPARGGNAGLSDEQVRAAVVHILKQSGIEAE